MKRSLFTILAVVALMLMPQLVPNVQMTPTDQMQITEVQTAPTIANTAGIVTNTATTSFEIPITDMTVTISPGGEAFAWNLVLILCQELHWDDMCDLYDHGLGEGWWDE